MLFVLCERLHAFDMSSLVTCTGCRLSVGYLILEHRSFRWLRKLPVVEAGHLFSDFHQQGLEALVTVPVGEDREFALVDLSVQLGDEWEVHARQKLDARGFIRVFLATGDLQTVNPVLVYSMPRSDDCSVPVTHHDIVRIIEAVRT